MNTDPQPQPDPEVPETEMQEADLEMSIPVQMPAEMTPDAEIQAVKLGDVYDECLLGATMRGNFAYSLKRMIAFEVSHRRVEPGKAREVLAADIIELMRVHGNMAPEFIDDELMVEPVKIIVPGQN